MRRDTCDAWADSRQVLALVRVGLARVASLRLDEREATRH